MSIDNETNEVLEDNVPYPTPVSTYFRPPAKRMVNPYDEVLKEQEKIL